MFLQCSVVQLDQPEQPPLQLAGHSGEVTAVAWCPSDITQFTTASDDGTVRVWGLDRSVPAGQLRDNCCIGRAGGVAAAAGGRGQGVRTQQEQEQEGLMRGRDRQHEGEEGKQE